MSYISSSDIVDLTDSFILADHCAFTNTIINLDTDVDSSFEIYERVNQATKKKDVKQKKSSKNNDPTQRKPRNQENKRYSKFGDCSICWDELGNNPLASTKCGHVFCTSCLKQALKLNKRCPTCRTILKGSSAFHPIYLSTN